EAVRVLTLGQRFWGLRTESRVSVSMQELPDAVLQSIHAGHAKRDIAQIRTPTHLGYVALDLNRVREIRSDEPLYRLEAGRMPISEVGCGAPECFDDLIPTVCDPAPRIRQGDLFTIRVKQRVRLRIALDDHVERCSRLLRRALEVT